MKISDLNEYIQTLAAVGAIVALLAVGYEIRQSNRIALQETTSSNWSNWISMAGQHMESGISRILAKSMTNPNDLTLAEKIDLDSYLQQYVYGYHHDYSTLRWGDSDLAAAILNELAIDAPTIFGSRFSRAWFQENKAWMDPDIVAVVEHELEEFPIGSDLDYYDRIEAMAVAMK